LQNQQSAVDRLTDGFNDNQWRTETFQHNLGHHKFEHHPSNHGSRGSDKAIIPLAISLEKSVVIFHPFFNCFHDFSKGWDNGHYTEESSGGHGKYVQICSVRYKPPALRNLFAFALFALACAARLIPVPARLLPTA
jgi:hypothetical protein